MSILKNISVSEYSPPCIAIASQLLKPASPTKEDFIDLETEVEQRHEMVTTMMKSSPESSKTSDTDEGPFWARTIHPQSKAMVFIFGAEALCCLYNAWSIPFYFAFGLYRVRSCFFPYSLQY